MKILLMAGSGRSGSTILGNVLGSVEGFVHVGELHQIWIRGLTEDWLCGCGIAVRNCPVWKQIILRSFGHLAPADSEDIDDLRLELYSRLRQRGQTGHTRYPLLIEKLYREVAGFHGCRVIVDSSKHPLHARLMHILFGDSLYLLHLVRDPRAVAYSWRRPRQHPGAPYPFLMYRDGVGATSKAWLARNGLSEQLTAQMGPRAMRLRYEDFVTEPELSLARVLDFVAEPGEALPVIGDGRVKLARSHTISCNPSTVDHVGDIVIAPDDAWRHSMDDEEREAVTHETSHQLPRYGYPPD
ncbi:MAG: sulfotransferase [bacterium]|nr:sulfotransferase [bacterium]